MMIFILKDLSLLYYLLSLHLILLFIHLILYSFLLDQQNLYDLGYLL